ncbi:MAG: hypothetical protein HY644_08925 [Acidobacteria bacterium]|nr:hypothetical protein [Acidobacteriota bacterium]
MECPACKDNLTAYLDDELIEKDQELMEQHLGHCVPCKAEFESLSRSYQLVTNALEVIEPRAQLWKRIEAAIQPQPQSVPSAGWQQIFSSLFRTPLRRFGVASFAIILLASSMLLFQQSDRRSDPQTEALQQQLNEMIERMDQQELLPHNFFLSPTGEEYGSNPFAVHDASLDLNPFQTETVRATDQLVDDLLKGGTTNFTTDESETKEAR